ncbi:hypothetical protein BN6_17580 [Saccharothrix espanaensis DSM 44229]|uniref:Uncharacterized protein n=1 Tax=Saccharothrix espanaensis (strain ATCC 51144 / DSM 44229 / JCM 9112 / NBRC 15066 / NRRL 15764) TaxID=1179773 RepID=K0JWB8_SACES|nr:hypothetical protein BN6_17580 [Saccharothrix espanaensis DSM 44229]
MSAAPDRVRTARAACKRSAVRRSVHAPLRRLLEEMAPGHQRCRYRGDSQGTDSDHFEPLSRNPLRTFDWLNHLPACSTCDSNLKRDRYPLDDAGRPLLVDRVVVMSLPRWSAGRARGAGHEVREAVLTVQGQPFADVCQAMPRLSSTPGAARVLDGPVLAVLRDPELRARLPAWFRGRASSRWTPRARTRAARRTAAPRRWAPRSPGSSGARRPPGRPGPGPR